MRIPLRKSLVLLILVMALVFSGTLSAAATQTEETEPAAPEIKEYLVDTQSELYLALAELAPSLKSDQILVYDATADEILPRLQAMNTPAWEIGTITRRKDGEEQVEVSFD